MVGTELLLEEARQAGVKQFFGERREVYGSVETGMSTEEDRLAPAALTQPARREVTC